MRSIVVWLVVLAFVPTISAADWSEPRDGIGVSVLRVEDDHVYVTWTAAPGAVTYQLFRGPTLDALKLVTQTPNLAFTDLDAPAENTWYVVISQVASTALLDGDFGPMRGKCLAVRGLTGISVTVSNCMPMRLP